VLCYPLQATHTSEAVDPFRTFLNHMSHQAFINSGPLGAVFDSMLTTTTADKHIPCITTKACDILEATGSGVDGLVAVFQGIHQGKSLIRNARLHAERSAKEMSFLQAVTDSRAICENLLKQPDIGYTAIDAVLAAAQALHKAAPKVSNDAAKAYCDDLRHRASSVLQKSLQHHIRCDIMPWLSAAVSSYKNTKLIADRPAWHSSKLDHMKQTRIAHNIDLGELPAILDLHLIFDSLFAVVSKASTNSLMAADAVKLTAELSQFEKSQCVVLNVWEPTFLPNLREFSFGVNSLADSKVESDIAIHASALAKCLSKARG
jgi:hypothetical protein